VPALKKREKTMADVRKMIDCGTMPSDNNCSLKISGREDEVLKAAVEHAVSSHGHANTPELREGIRQMMKDEALATA